jgi:3-hydroxyisobutyrate dehydrogenase-like beta-hydroxyacid dehydrogenase
VTVANNTVSIIGVGDMGSALAHTALGGGYEVTLWNRTAARVDPFRDTAARIAETPAEAVDASSVSVLILADYPVAREVMDTDAVRPLLSGRVIVNLISGEPQQANEFGAWVTERSGRYLDGRIGSYPSDVGRETSAMIYGGDADAFAECEPLLHCFAPQMRYVGTDLAAANALAAAMFSLYHHAVNESYYEAVAFAARYGVSPADCLPLARQQLQIAAEAIGRGTQMCLDDRYEGDQSSLDTHLGALGRTQRALAAAGAPHAITDGMMEHLKAAVGAGRGSQQLAGLYPFLRDA